MRWVFAVNSDVSLSVSPLVLLFLVKLCSCSLTPSCSTLHAICLCWSLCFYPLGSSPHHQVAPLNTGGLSLQPPGPALASSLAGQEPPHVPVSGAPSGLHFPAGRIPLYALQEEKQMRCHCFLLDTQSTVLMLVSQVPLQCFCCNYWGQNSHSSVFKDLCGANKPQLFQQKMAQSESLLTLSSHCRSLLYKPGVVIFMCFINFTFLPAC